MSSSKMNSNNVVKLPPIVRNTKVICNYQFFISNIEIVMHNDHGNLSRDSLKEDEEVKDSTSSMILVSMALHNE
jgi:hypothetical protein